MLNNEKSQKRTMIKPRGEIMALLKILDKIK